MSKFEEKMKRISLLLISMSVVFSVDAQNKNYLKEYNVFQHLDASVTLGTTGIGFDVSSPVGDYVNLRAGFDFMPHFHHNMNFGVQVGETNDKSKFNKLATYLEELTGYKVNDHVKMIGLPTYNNVKFLVDVFPFKQNKCWHVTAGFYLGPSKIAEAYNSTEDMPSLLAVGIYNHIYPKAINEEPFITVTMDGVQQGWPDDPEIQEKLHKKFAGYGRMGMHVGNYDDGSAYLMEPGEDGMVRASMKVNAFKPYLGVGYGGRLLKNNDKFHVAVDLGALFWGGSPSIVTHEGVNLTKDVSNISGKVGDYVSLAKTFKVFPVLDVRLIYNIF
jgi:hypothetical protein